MKSRNVLVYFAILFSCTAAAPKQEKDSRFVSFFAAPSSIRFYWKDDKGEMLRSIYNLKKFVESGDKKLKFAMNGGMYMEDNSPLGLFIENGETIRKLNTKTGYGNFYMKPNGVFYLTNDNKAIVCETSAFWENGEVKFATQSGPMLVVDGKMHPSLMKGSTHLNIRNGVGILPDGSVMFAMSKKEINFYDFAAYFQQQGCKNAVYLDGFVSRTYAPEEKWEQLDGNFGVMIGVVE